MIPFYKIFKLFLRIQKWLQWNIYIIFFETGFLKVLLFETKLCFLLTLFHFFKYFFTLGYYFFLQFFDFNRISEFLSILYNLFCFRNCHTCLGKLDQINRIGLLLFLKWPGYRYLSRFLLFTNILLRLYYIINLTIANFNIMLLLFIYLFLL